MGVYHHPLTLREADVQRTPLVFLPQLPKRALHDEGELGQGKNSPVVGMTSSSRRQESFLEQGQLWPGTRVVEGWRRQPSIDLFLVVACEYTISM